MKGKFFEESILAGLGVRRVPQVIFNFLRCDWLIMRAEWPPAYQVIKYLLIKFAK